MITLEASGRFPPSSRLEELRQKSLYQSLFFSCLHDRATVRSGAEIGLLSLRLSVSQGASLGDFLLAPACPIEKVTLWECDQPGKNPLKYSAMAGNRTRVTGRTDSELFH